MSRLQPMRDNGQTLPGLRGMVIGIVDTGDKLDDVVTNLESGGFSRESMVCLHGDDGISLVKRVDGNFFGDSEDGIGKTSIAAMQQGKYALGVKVANGDEARKASTLAGEKGGHGFIHFGLFVSTQFN
ncbi:MAG: hypothetical protein NXI04_16315 [Planctomycetaceae bacterium]|nr:hypothetical protein [Planctomycetaceae bacterium]